MTTESDARTEGFLPVIRRWWWLLALAALAGGLAAAGAASRIAPAYEAQAELLVGPLTGDVETLRAAGLMAQTYAELAKTRPLRDAVKKQLALENVGGSISASADDVTRLLKVRVRHHDAELGARVANSIATELVKLSKTDPPVVPKTAPPEAAAPAASAGRLRLVEPAKPGRRSVSTGANTLIPLGALAGAIVALALAVLLDRSGDRVSRPGDLDDSGATFLGSVAATRWERGIANRLVVDSLPHSAAARDYRLLAAKLSAQLDELARNGVRSVLVVPADGETKTGVFTANLALAFSRSGTETVLIDASEDGEATSVLGRERQPDADEDVTPADASQQRFDGLVVRVFDRLSLLPRGQAGSAALQPEGARRLLAALRDDVGVVVVDSAPVSSSAGTLAWAAAVDGTVVVAQRNRTPRARVASAAESLRLIGGHVIGTALTERRRRARGG